jgi:hypothetical protein
MHASTTVEETRTRRRALPTFLLVGAMKAGTTSLYHYLAAHPQVLTPRYKAPEFFVEEANWSRGVEWYRRQFPPAGDDVVAIGEASNAYTKYPTYRGVPERIAGLLPEVRLVYCVRDPIARIRSHYQTKVAEGSERAPFEVAVSTDHRYVDYSRYATQLDRYLEHFPTEQILVITAEDLRARRADTVSRVYEFLGVNATVRPPELERDFYRTSDRAARSPVPLRLRKTLKKRFPWTRRFKELENDTLAAVRRLIPRAPQPAPADRFVVAESVQRRLRDELAPEVERLRRFLPAEFDGWGIA